MHKCTHACAPTPCPARAQVSRFDGHADYVRAGAVSPANAETWATGGYDHVCKLWDTRDPKGGAVMDLDHGAPVEDLAFFPSGGGRAAR